MSPLYLYNGKLLIDNNQLASNQNCCCEPCECTPLSCTVNFTVDGQEFTWSFEDSSDIVAPGVLSKTFEFDEELFCDQFGSRKYYIQATAYCANGVWRIGVGFYLSSILDGDCYYWDPDFTDDGGYRNIYYHQIKLYTVEVSACDCSSVTDLGSQFLDMFLEQQVVDLHPLATYTAMTGEWASNIECGPICGDYEGSPDECPEPPTVRFPVRPWNPACSPADREITVSVECCGGVCCQTSCGCASQVTVTGLGAWGFDDPLELQGFGYADYDTAAASCPGLTGQNRCLRYFNVWEWTPDPMVNDNYAVTFTGSLEQGTYPDDLCNPDFTSGCFSIYVYTRADWDAGNSGSPVASADWCISPPESIVPLPHTLGLSNTVCDNCGDIAVTAEIFETDCAEANRCDSTSTQAECEANGGTWHQGSTCEDNPCTSPNYCPTAGLECPPDCVEQCAVCFNVYCFGPGEGENFRGGFPCPGCPEGLTLVNGECVGISTSNNCDADCSLIIAEKEPIFTAFFGGPRQIAWDSADETTTIICNPLP